MRDTMVSGFIVGTGAAVNTELGFIPDLVIVWDGTTGSPMNIGNPRQRVMVYSGGGTNEIKAGMEIVGNTSGAKAMVLAVHNDTGTWAGGDAAGWLILDAETETGTFTSETIYYTGSDGTDDATGAATAVMGVDIDTEVATDTGITAYKGSAASNALGFTIAIGISVDAKLLPYMALRNG